MFHKFKTWLLPRGTAPRTVPLGMFKGLRLSLDFASQSQIYLGLWERETYTFVSQIKGHCVTAIDVGACRGEFTLLFLSLPTVKQVIAIEPWAANVKLLQDNLDLNQKRSDSRLSICTKKLGASPSPDITTLDELDLSHDGSLFIKIDVDGAEMDVLRGGAKRLSQSDVTLLIETHSLELEDQCLSFLEPLGYQCHIIHNAWWRSVIPEDRPIGHNRWLWAVRS